MGVSGLSASDWVTVEEKRKTSSTTICLNKTLRERRDASHSLSGLILTAVKLI